MLPFIEKALAAQPKPKKTVLSTVNVKKLVATVEKLGKGVAAVTAAPDGSVTVSVGEPSPMAGKASPNVWDEVL